MVRKIGRLPNSDFWLGRKVFLTGHTGFKGGWLSIWLHQMGAKVTGFGLEPDTKPSLFNLASVSDNLQSIIGDVRDFELVKSALIYSGAEIVLHLAAQPLVRASYVDPLNTFSTNVIGTANILQAARQVPSVKVVQIVTTDKCYENKEWEYPYRETDRLGGYDPYSSSKACAELVSDSFRRSFMEAEGIQLATSRAGNVIGGGDWAVDRIVPDCIRALQENRPIIIRSPASIRPWQHVLEPLSGYLVLAEDQFLGQSNVAGGFNFGPEPASIASVAELAAGIVQFWGGGQLDIVNTSSSVHEANILKLDISKAATYLAWGPRWDFERTLFNTVDWYKRVLCLGEYAGQVCINQINEYKNSL